MDKVCKRTPQLSLRVIASVSRLLSATVDRAAGVRGALETLREALDADSCAVLLPDETNARLVVAFDASRAGSAVLPREFVAMGSLCGGILDNGRPIFVEDVTKSEQRELAAAEGLTAGAFWGVPVISCGKVAAVLRATRITPDWDVPAEQRDWLSIAAHLLVVSLVAVNEQSAQRDPHHDELAHVFDKVYAGLLTVDPDLRIRLWNSRLLSLLDLQPNRMESGIHLSRVLPPALWRQIKSRVEETARSGNETRTETDVAMTMGEVGPMEVRTVALESSATGRHGVLIMLTDMSMQRELAQLRRLEDLEANFLSMVSHELRTPLTSIKGAIGILSSGGAATAPDQFAALVRIVQNNTERLIHLVDDLLDVSTIEHHALTLHFETLDLQALLHAGVTDVFLHAERKECRVHTDLHEVKIRGDQKRLRQVFSQLLGNAVKFSRRGGDITVRLRANSSVAVATIRDSGFGIPAHAWDKVFDKFYQVEDPMTRSAGGTGIGLFIVKAIVEAHGGRVRVQDSGDWGTEMAVELPCLPTDAQWPCEADGARWSGH
jgi:signal transduction histidine kinase